jgi:hypothetical protein
MPEIAEIFGKVTGRKVKYIDAPEWIMPKVAKTIGIPDFIVAQILTYFEEYRRNAFGIGAPTEAVLEVSGREPEDFETIARRYMTPILSGKRGISAYSKMLLSLARAMLTSGVNLEKYERQYDLPKLTNARSAVEAPEWLANHDPAYKAHQIVSAEV